MTEHAEVQAPSLPRRLIAITYDLLLVIAVVAVVNAMALGIQVRVLGSAQHELHPQLAQFFTVASIFGFFTLFWVKQGQTLGMQAWRIRLKPVAGEGRRLARRLHRGKHRNQRASSVWPVEPIIERPPHRDSGVRVAGSDTADRRPSW